jgi:hypothetical protein
MKDNQHEQLFTELTSLEGSTISGGVTKVNLKYLSVSDTQEWPRDEAYLTVDGNKIWSKTVGVGDHRIDKTFDISGSSDTLRFFEDDTWPSNHELLGAHTIPASRRGTDFKASFTQNGANYTLVYDVFRA